MRATSPDFRISSAKLLPTASPCGIRLTRLTVGISWTNAPRPCSTRTRPSERKSAMARLIDVWFSPYRRARSGWLGRAEPGGKSPRLIAARSSSATCR